jgi:hypothetical protein
MAGKIFINYRRGDDAGFTQALYLRLKDEFAADDLFMDVEGHIKPGDDFVEVLNEQVAKSDVLLAVIGPRWAELLTARQGDPDDFVAIEIKAALEQGKCVIPVLVGEARMPRANDLPEPIRPLVRRNAVSVRLERFNTDCQGLVAALNASIAQVNQDQLWKAVISGASERMIDHFCSWAKPNAGLYIDEFVAFAICFPIIDLSWRIGAGMPDNRTFVRLLDLMGKRSVQSCWQRMAQKGFDTGRGKPEPPVQLIHARVEEYAAAYLLDRQEVEWSYGMTCKQAARNCLAPSHSSEITDFMALLESVIDRARGRVKKEFRKAQSAIAPRRGLEP